MCSFASVIKRGLSRIGRAIQHLLKAISSGAAEMVTNTELEYRSWAGDKESMLADLSVEFEEATETHLQVLVNGGKLQILIPSTYHLDSSASLDSGEVFLVLTMGDVNGKVESSMLALNERLEQISVKPNSLHKVLDLLLAALKKLDAHRGSKRKFENDEMDWEQEDVQDHSDSEDCNSEEDYHSDEEGEVDSSCYDIAVGETGTSCTTEYETRTRGYLHALAEDARKKCEEFQKGECRDLHKPLMWFRVVSKPMLLMVQLQFEVAGMIDERIAAGLGLTLNEPVSVNLEFSKSVWSESIFRSEKLLKYERVTASQSSLVSNQVIEKDPDEIDRFLESSSGDHHRSYGLEVLFPELTARFFADLNQETPSDDVHLEGLEYDKLNNKNPFICLALFISLQLKLLPGWCLVCWKKLPFSVTRMRTCDDDLCLYRFEELGLGVSVLDEVQSNPALVEADLSLAFSAVESSRDVFEPFPGFLLVNQQIRGRSGWFSNKSVPQPGRQKPTSAVVRTQPEGRVNKMTVTLKEVLSSIPAVEELMKCSTERVLKKTLTRAWYLYKYRRGKSVLDSDISPSWQNAEDAEAWKKESQMPYNVVRFILMTNRLSLSLLSPENEVLKAERYSTTQHPDRFSPGTDETDLTIYQFVVLHDTPEKEAYFSRKREAQGSFFAFHGSGAENWYSILRNGLRSMSNTTYMSTGAAYGEGIYMATDLVTSMSYARAVGSSWPNGKLHNGFQCVAICEVINGSPRPSAAGGSRHYSVSNILVVPRENERDVAIRYLLVFKPKLALNTALSRCIQIEGHSLSGNPKINLLDHYQLLRKSQEEAQLLQQRTQMSARGAIFLSADQNEPPAGPQLVLPTSSTVVTPSMKKKADQTHPQPPKQVRRAVEPLTKTPTSSNLGSRAVMQEFSNLVKSINKSPPIASFIEKGEPAPVLSGTTVTLPDEEGNLSLWRISLHPYLLKESTDLYNDFKELKRLQKAGDDVPVVLEVKFPTTFPFAPPFVRVLSPRFRMHSGHVTVGGSICMELLTASGWSPACNFESLLVQVVMAFVEGEGRLDLKVSQHGREYQEGEAREAFQRAARAHGWKTS